MVTIICITSTYLMVYSKITQHNASSQATLSDILFWIVSNRQIPLMFCLLIDS